MHEMEVVPQLGTIKIRKQFHARLAAQALPEASLGTCLIKQPAFQCLGRGGELLLEGTAAHDVDAWRTEV